MNSELSDLTRLCDAETFAFSAENPTGAKGGGSRGEPWEKLHACVRIKPGETIELVNTDGPGTIQSIWIGGYPGSTFILRMYWDSQEYPSVEAPLPAFFGYPFFEQVVDVTGKFPTLNSLPVLVTPCIGLNCYWEMPFRKHCRITVENRGKDPNSCYYMITGKRQKLSDRVAYFHASYRQERPVTRDREYTVIDGIKGKGHFVGVAFASGLNGDNGCWVEGEAKMFIDGDTHPTVNYTGTEDYFCGSYAFGDDAALGHYQTYSGPYVGMFAMFKSDGSKRCSQDRFMAYRWHIKDPIYFNTDFRMTLQSMEYTPYGGRTRRDDYSSVAFWYQSLPSNPLKPLPSREEVYLK